MQPAHPKSVTAGMHGESLACLQVPLVINDRIDVAIASGADGAHIGQEDLPVVQARRLLGPSKILGVSCKTVEQALRAEAEGADYIGSGAGMLPLLAICPVALRSRVLWQRRCESSRRMRQACMGRCIHHPGSVNGIILCLGCGINVYMCCLHQRWCCNKLMWCCSAPNDDQGQQGDQPGHAGSHLRSREHPGGRHRGYDSRQLPALNPGRVRGSCSRLCNLWGAGRRQGCSGHQREGGHSLRLLTLMGVCSCSFAK